MGAVQHSTDGQCDLPGPRAGRQSPGERDRHDDHQQPTRSVRDRDAGPQSPRDRLGVRGHDQDSAKLAADAGFGSALGYGGASGWVQLQPLTERAGLRAACAEVAAKNVSQYGRHPFIGYLRIDGRPGCQIPAVLANAGTAIPLATALVEYRSPISGGANFLLISGDPATMTGMFGSVRLHH